MKKWLEKTWNDPVWSKVIGGIILASPAALYSVVKGLISKTESVKDVFKTVFSYKINFWLALIIVLCFLIIVSLVKQKRNKKKAIPILPFVSDFTEGLYQGMQWKWRWQWSKSFGIYYLIDLNLVCPQCKDGVLTVGYMNYRCGKCGADIPYRMLNVDHDAVKTQILADARKYYNSCANYIGEINSGYVKT